MPLVGRRTTKIFRGRPPTAELPWYLVDGVDAANCVVAYKAKGAASLAASLVNQANPGTHDATAPVAAPTFDAATGWTFDGATQYLSAGDLSVTQNFTALMRFSDFVYGTIGGWPIGFYVSNDSFCICFDNQEGYATGAYIVDVNALDRNQVSPAGVAALNADGYYFDGNLVVAPASPPSAKTMHTGVLIGCAFYSTAPGMFSNIKIQAVAIFNRTLTATEMAAISAKLAAL